MNAPKTIKMLSIDDKTVTTDLDRAGYRKMGVLVRAAASFDEASRLLKSDEIDLVVINMDYKNVDAVQITKHLKAQDAFKEKPVVLTSVQTTQKVRNAALDAGADLFVEQPLPRQYFIEKLKQLLEQSTRTTERVDAPGDATIVWDGRTETCTIGDLSISGMLLSTEVPIADGTKLDLSFELPGNKKPIRVLGEVVRTIKFATKTPDRQTGVGVRFTEFQGDSQKRLERYVEKTAHGDARMQYYL